MATSLVPHRGWSIYKGLHINGRRFLESLLEKSRITTRGARVIDHVFIILRSVVIFLIFEVWYIAFFDLGVLSGGACGPTDCISNVRLPLWVGHRIDWVVNMRYEWILNQFLIAEHVWAQPICFLRWQIDNLAEIASPGFNDLKYLRNFARVWCFRWHLVLPFDFFKIILMTVWFFNFFHVKSLVGITCVKVGAFFTIRSRNQMIFDWLLALGTRMISIIRSWKIQIPCDLISHKWFSDPPIA
jgi:hypothetical protein